MADNITFGAGYIYAVSIAISIHLALRPAPLFTNDVVSGFSEVRGVEAGSSRRRPSYRGHGSLNTFRLPGALGRTKSNEQAS